MKIFNIFKKKETIKDEIQKNVQFEKEDDIQVEEQEITNYDLLKKAFYDSFKEGIINFSKSNDNKEVYAIVFDCDKDNGQICIRYATEKSFKELMKDYNKYKYMYEDYDKYCLVAYKYSVGDFNFIDFEEKPEMEHFNASYYHYIYEQKYYGQGKPIKLITYDNKKINIKKELNSLVELWEKLIIENINQLMNEELGIDKTNDFIMFMTLHDQTDEETKKYIKKTISEEMYKKVFINNKLVK